MRPMKALLEAMSRALDAITSRDAEGFFKHCECRLPVRPCDPRCSLVRSSENLTRARSGERGTNPEGLDQRQLDLRLLAQRVREAELRGVVGSYGWGEVRAAYGLGSRERFFQGLG